MLEPYARRPGAPPWVKVTSLHCPATMTSDVKNICRRLEAESVLAVVNRLTTVLRPTDIFLFSFSIIYTILGYSTSTAWECVRESGVIRLVKSPGMSWTVRIAKLRYREEKKKRKKNSSHGKDFTLQESTGGARGKLQRREIALDWKLRFAQFSC